MRVLAITNMYPSATSPASGVFVEQQVLGLKALGVDVQVLLIDRRREGAWAYYRMRPKVVRAISEACPDLLHCMYGGVMARQVSLMPALPPFAITFHGADLYGENLSGLLRKWVSHYGVHCSKKAALKADGIVVVAQFLRKFLPPSCHPPSSVSQPATPNPQHSTPIVRTIPCGIDLERFRPMDKLSCKKQLGWRSEDLNVLFVSGWGYGHKRPWMARAAVEQALAMGTPAVLRSLSGIPNSDVPVWINASDVLILTSYDEASPTIVKEALACNLPVVSVDVGDVAERITGITGCHLVKADPDALARGLRSVYETGKRVEGRVAVASLSHTNAAKQLKQFYAEILTAKKTVESIGISAF